MFESCGVSSPEKSPLNMANYDMAQGVFPYLNQSLEAIKKESVQQYESMARQQSDQNLFQFPQRPIEKIQLLNSEVELERQSAKRKYSLLSQNEGGDNGSIDSEIELPMKKSSSSPYYQMLSIQGDNVSGVNNLAIVCGLTITELRLCIY